MKTVFLIVSLLAAAALAGWGVHQQRQLQHLRIELTDAQAQLAETEAQLAELAASKERIELAERKARVLQETLSETSALSADQTRQMSEMEASLAAAQTNDGGFARIFKDPGMRDMIRAQQKAVMGPMIAKNYAALFEKLKLSPEQTAQLKALLEEKMLATADLGLEMMGESGDSEKRKELMNQMKEAADELNDQLKDLLGADGFDTLKSYEKSLGDRMSAGQFRDQLAGSEMALEGAQEQQLIDLMTQTRSEFSWTTDFNNRNPGDVDYAEMFNEDRLDRFFEETASYHQALLDRAKAFMRPDQLNSLATFLENQRNTQMMAMKLAAKMFGPKPK